MGQNWADFNIQNLFHLWQAMGAESCVRSDGSVIHQSRSWPHRCWVTGVTDEPIGATELPVNPMAIYPKLPAGLEGRAMGAAIDALGMKEAFSQTAMVWRRRLREGTQIGAAHSARSLPSRPSPTSLRLLKPSDQAQVDTWVEVASGAFGSAIDTRIFNVLTRQPSAHLVVALAGQRAVATALLFRTGKVVGLHQFGVLPEAQGKGYARQLLQALLQPAYLGDSEAVTLQASVAGFPLYQKQGFESLFGIRNFRRAEPLEL